MYSGVLGPYPKIISSISPSNPGIKALSFNSSLSQVPLFYENESHYLFVNKDYFSDLTIVSAIYENQETIGNFKKIENDTDWRTIPEFLIESGIIKTFIHIGANLCLTKEDDTQDAYTANFNGEHIYYTNKKNVEDYKFQVRIDKKTGEITVLGGTD